MAPVGLILKSQGSFAPNMEESRPPKDLYAAMLSRNGEVAKLLGMTEQAASLRYVRALGRLKQILEQVIPGAFGS